MEAAPSFDNQKLLKTKRESLDSLFLEIETIPNKSEFIASYSFHGFIIDFYSANTCFSNSILNFLPDEWKNKEDSVQERGISVYLINNWGEDWDLEINPDCYIQSINGLETAIQRDFIGINSGNSVFLNLDKTLGDGIFNALRWILPRRMLEKEFFLLHSSCVVEDGKAYFFLGHSGAGKSTIASLAGDRMVLGDDMNVMRVLNGTIFAKAGGLGGMSFESTDFENEYPVAGFYWLKQDIVNKKVKLKTASSVSKLLASFANVFWEYMTKEERAFLIEEASKVAEICPFYELHFKKEEECWDYVK